MPVSLPRQSMAHSIHCVVDPSGGRTESWGSAPGRILRKVSKSLASDACVSNPAPIATQSAGFQDAAGWSGSGRRRRSYLDRRLGRRRGRRCRVRSLPATPRRPTAVAVGCGRATCVAVVHGSPAVAPAMAAALGIARLIAARLRAARGRCTASGLAARIGVAAPSRSAAAASIRTERDPQHHEDGSDAYNNDSPHFETPPTIRNSWVLAFTGRPANQLRPDQI